MPDCLSHFTVLRWTLRQLPTEQLERVGAHIDGCPCCRAAVDEAHADIASYQRDSVRHTQRLRAQLQRKASTAAKAPRPHRRPRKSRGLGDPARSWLLGAAALAAAAAVLLVVNPGQVSTRVLHTGQYIGLKGDINLRATAQRGGVRWPVEEGQQLRAGDALQLTITAPQSGFVTVFSLDGRGELTRYYPRADSDAQPQAASIAGVAAQPIEGSWVLDDSPGTEVVIAAFSPRPFLRADVHRRLGSLIRGGAADRLGEEARQLGLEIAVLRLRKRP